MPAVSNFMLSILLQFNSIQFQLDLSVLNLIQMASKEARIKSLKSGWQASGLDWNSGWN